MRFKVEDVEIEVECPEKMEGLVRGMTLSQAYRLLEFQRQPRNWPGHANIPAYCLYLGSGELDGQKVDFYHYEGLEYSTGIVFGNEAGDYMSGWPELGMKRAVYREHMRRELLCGLLTMDDLARVGVAALGVDWGNCDSSVRDAREGFGKKSEEG